MAASGTAVTVLTPNGRRQTVKVSPNTPLLQVLEDVCKKHGFTSDDHGLKFQRTVLDLTLQWRFANLPNNAKLEIVPSTRKTGAADSQVRIALQMEDGSRLQGSFSSGQTLWELLTHFPETSVLQLSESGAVPVCVYMRDEVVGEDALKNSTLKSLGLAGGSAIVRFLIKRTQTQAQNGEKVVEPAAVAVDDTLCPVRPERVTPDVATSSADKSTAHSPMAKSPTAKSPMAKSPTAKSPMANSPIAKSPIAKSPIAKSPMANSPIAKSPIAKSPTASSPSALTPTTNSPALKTEDSTHSTCSIPEQQDKAENPQDALRPKESESETTEAPCCSSSLSAPPAPFIPFSGGGQRLGGPGVVSSVRPSLVGPASVDSPKAKKQKSSNKPAVPYDEDMNQEGQYLEPVERESLVYHMDGQLHHSNDTELPDEFFEVTVDDIRKRFAQLKSERKVLEEAPLMTKALREAQMREKMQRYPKVVLRIQFPDRHVLQGFFRPMETVGALRQFVRSHLEDPQLSFYLFITPPKTILKDPTMTLYQADLFPGALVYFGSDVKTGSYLKTALLDSSVSASQANESIVSFLPSQTPSSSTQDQEEPVSLPDQSMDTSEPSPDDTPCQNQAPKPRPDPGKVPKWLKLPGKK